MNNRTIKVWDWPVRLSHWSFVLLVPALWWTAENSEMGWHMRLGQILLGIVIFRILWGFLGSETARFASFVRSPGAIAAYLRGTPDKDTHVGHNPLGAVAVIVLLLALLAQTSFGLFAGDPFDGATGPLNETVGVLTADMLTEWHEALFWVIVGLIALHLVAVLLYHAIGGKNLIGPMVTGRKASDSAIPDNTPAPFWRLLLCLALSAGMVAALASGWLAKAIS